MRKFLISVVILSVPVAFAAPSSAMEAKDTMRSWKNASASERKSLLEQLLGKSVEDSRGANILKCLDATANIPGHIDLEIGEIAKACATPANGGEPV